MTSLPEPTNTAQRGPEAASAYEPPTLTLLGNAHDLLAMAKTYFCDDVSGSAGDFQDPGVCDAG